MKSLSIIIPTRNAGKYLSKSLSSIDRTSRREIVVVDNLSGDNTVEIAKQAGCNCFSEPDSGQAEALNKGIRRSSGDIIGFLNADDLLFSNALEIVEETFSRFPDVMALYGQAVHIDESGNWLEDYPSQPWDYQNLKTHNFICQPATFWRRQVHDQLGYFDESLHFALDYDFWLRVGQHYPFLYLDNLYLAKSRLHPEAKTLKYPRKAKWENLLVKHRHTGKVDIQSAFGYCSLVAEEEVQENQDSARYAELFLEGMREVEPVFAVDDRHTWFAAREQMVEMTTISRPPAKRPLSKPRILVDLSLFQPGGVHGGIKPALYCLLKEFMTLDHFTVILVIDRKLETETAETFGTTMQVVLCDKDTNADQLLETCRQDLVFCPLPSLRFRHPDVPLVFLSPDLLHIDYPDSLEPGDREYRQNLFIEATSKADLILTVSKFSRNRLIQQYNVPHRKVWAIPHALPHPTKRQRSDFPFNATPHFLYPANFWTHKNHKTLLVAYKGYLQRAEKPWKLILTGHPETGNPDEINRLIKILGLQAHVQYKGYLTGADYEAVWAETGALVFPSNYEGFGLPLLEAMDWGIPIIAANLPSLKEVAASAALYIDQLSPDLIVKALLEISEDEELRKSLVEKGHIRLKDFSWKQAAETFSNLVTNLLMNRSHPYS